MIQNAYGIEQQNSAGLPGTKEIVDSSQMHPNSVSQGFSEPENTLTLDPAANGSFMNKRQVNQTAPYGT